MPKKSAHTRRGVQRNKPKVQKSFELVRPEKVETEVEERSTTPVNTSTSVATQEDSQTSTKAATTVRTKEDSKTVNKASKDSSTQEDSKNSTKKEKDSTTQEEQEAKTQERQTISAQGSASARLAARRQAAQRLQQRSAATLITSEHFAYVRKDLIKIAIFAVLMFTAIIVLYLTLGQ